MHLSKISFRSLISVIALFLASTAWSAETTAWEAQIDRLVRQLSHEQLEMREQAVVALIKIAPTSSSSESDAFLKALPVPNATMPPDLQVRLHRIRKSIENLQNENALGGSRLTLSAKSKELGTLFDDVFNKTGNRLTDFRDQFGQENSTIYVTFKAEDELFWPSLDKILDQTSLDLYPYSGEKSLAVIEREIGAGPRHGAACYSGPFRIEATSIVLQSNSRTPSEQGGHIELEIAWEPRLQPIAISQNINKLSIVTNDGSTLKIEEAQEDLAVEVQPGSHATELNIPFELPPRSVISIDSLKGELSTIVPGKIAEFRFKDFSDKIPLSKKLGGIRVELNSLRKGDYLWEFHMQLHLESGDFDLNSHRGWVLQNLTYLLNKKGEVIDHVGLETTMQTNKTIGLAYFFDLQEEQLEGYTWVYRTPASIVRKPVKFELKEIALP